MTRPARICLALLLTVSFASADDADDALARGIQLRREHRDADALEQFRRAYELRAAPRTRAQIALAEQALGQWTDAEKDLGDAMIADDPWIRGHAELLNGALAAIRRHLGTLLIETNAPQAELSVNGKAA